jgi:hypothetical protein
MADLFTIEVEGPNWTRAVGGRFADRPAAERAAAKVGGSVVVVPADPPERQRPTYSVTVTVQVEAWTAEEAHDLALEAVGKDATEIANADGVVATNVAVADFVSVGP